MKYWPFGLYSWPAERTPSPPYSPRTAVLVLVGVGELGPTYQCQSMMSPLPGSPFDEQQL